MPKAQKPLYAEPLEGDPHPGLGDALRDVVDGFLPTS